jgi:hypothetical protein
MGMRAHLVVVLCDLMLEHRALLLQMESCGLKLLLPLPQLVHMLVGRDLCVHRSPTPINRMRGSPVPPIRGAVVGTHDKPFGDHLVVRVIDDVRHETFTRGVVAPLTRDKIGD